MDRASTSLELSADRSAKFDREWIGAWNAHDIGRILAHYRGDVRFVSPFAARFGARHGEVRGRPASRDYFERGLDSYPPSRFQPIAALGGIGSIALHYGVGYRFGLARLLPGDRVLDVGGGSGMDVFATAVRAGLRSSVADVADLGDGADVARAASQEGFDQAALTEEVRQ